MKTMICKPATMEVVKEKAKTTSKAGAKKKKTEPSPEKFESSSGVGILFALEPRIMFDGAALATGAEVIQDTTTQDQTGTPGIDGETSTDSSTTDSSDSDALWTSGLSLYAPSDRKEIVFIDTSVDNYQILMDGIDPHAEVILLDSTRDGIEQIAEILGDRTDIDAIHIISHGNQGELYLGTGTLSIESMQGEYADELAIINQALTEEADFLIYGCNFGEGGLGQDAATLLAELTGADIAASNDLTGSTDLGGDWDLEVQTGTIESAVIVDEQAQEAFASVLATVTVDTTNDASNGDTSSIANLIASDGGDGISLREAIIAANNTAGTDTINFNILDALVGGAHTIQVNNPTDGGNFGLPGISEAVIIDGTTDPDFAGTPIIELDGSFTTFDEDGFVFYAGSDGSIVRGLVINSFDGDGIELLDADNVTIEGNYIGTDVTGTIAKANTFNGIRLNSGAADNVIGGTTAATRNVIAGNTLDGIYITGTGSDRNTIQGNYIGVDATGIVALGNGDDGVEIRSADNVIGGSTAGARNIISGNSSAGLDINTSSATGNIVRGNYIGTDYTGTVDLGNASAGIYLFSAQNNTIGGTTAADRNIISGNDGSGILRQGSNGGNLIQGNYIGTDVTGTLDLGNTQNGIAFAGSGADTIGAAVAGAGNVISGNNLDGISIGAGADGVTIQGNYIGTNAAGTGTIANTGDGISVNADSTQIGGTTALARNVISGNTGDGIQLTGDTNVVQGNYIGTDITGTVDLGNAVKGVRISSGGSGNTIGGTTSTARNLISGNDGDGIEIQDAGSDSNVIQGNYIGTDVTGALALGNTGDGIQISGGASSNTIGGTASGAENLISGNLDDGIQVIDSGTTGNVIQGNLIGTDVTGILDLGNADDGVQFSLGASSNTVGGTAVDAGNVISGNDDDGVQLGDSGTTGNVVQGNYIGTDVSGTLAIGNTNNGVLIAAGAASNIIGGTAAGAGNTIAYNSQRGISVNSSAGFGNSILGNQLYSNTGLGIDLSGGTEDGFGVTDNDVLDADTGPNLLQNYPVLSTVTTTGSQVTIMGSVNSTVTTTLRIEFFASTIADGSGHGEAERYLGFATVTTDSPGGNATINEVLTAVLAPGEFVTATATVIDDAGQVGVDDALAYGDTSEFAQNVVATGNAAPVITNLGGDSLGYTEGDGAVVIEQGADTIVSDVDSTDFDTGDVNRFLPSG